MNTVIKLPVHLYKRLEHHAQGFDTPVNVIERILNHYEGIEDTNSEVGSTPPETLKRVAGNKRDNTKYKFNGGIFGKGKLVLAVIKEYVASNPDVSYDTLLEVFPAGLQGTSGVFDTLDKANEIYQRTGHKRHYIDAESILQLSDCDVAVSNQWGAANINNIITVAQELGFDILPANR
jgi:hypothetical protein